jgi:hypothetical protein
LQLVCQAEIQGANPTPYTALELPKVNDSSSREEMPSAECSMVQPARLDQNCAQPRLSSLRWMY